MHDVVKEREREAKREKVLWSISTKNKEKINNFYFLTSDENLANIYTSEVDVTLHI